MQVAGIGVENLESIMKNIGIFRLTTGETMISMIRIHPGGGGIFTVLPVQIKDHDGEVYLDQWMPYVKDRSFYMRFSDIQFIKTDLMTYIKDNYIEYVNRVNKDDVIDLISSIQEHLDTLKQVGEVPDITEPLVTDTRMTLH